MKNDVSIKEKKFELFITDNELADIVQEIANRLNKIALNNPLFIAILNGSFLFAADIIRKITIPNSEISFIKLTSYSGTNTTGKVKQLLGINGDISGRNIIILEDIIDTGITLEKIMNLLQKEKIVRNFENNEIREFKIINPKTYKYLKIDFLKTMGSNIIRINEILMEGCVTFSQK